MHKLIILCPYRTEGLKRLLSIFAIFSLMSACAQPPKYDAITINNLKVGECYTQEDILQAFGQPTAIKEPTPSDAAEEYYIFYFGKDRLEFIEGEFYGFRLTTPSFAVNGLIRVGDPISNIDHLEGIKQYEKTELVQLVNWRPKEGGLYDWLSVDFYYDERGIITSISAFINDL